MSDSRYKYIDGTRTKLSSRQEIFCSSVIDRVSIISRETALAASLCTELATLDEHARRIESLVTQLPRSAALWKEDLIQAVESGLLLSFDEIRRRVVSGFETLTSPKVIDTIGIPTHGRPDVLERLLKGLTDHLRHFERGADVVVVDDSVSGVEQAANRRVISRFANSGEITVRYGNRESRKLFAASLAKETGVAEDVASFALVGSPEYPVTTGSCRNAILLESVGHCLLSLDDDVECRLAAIPDADDEIFLGTRMDSYRFFSDRENINGCRFVGDDLLGLHEGLLNTDRTAVAADTSPGGKINLSNVSPRFLKQIEGGDGAVIVSLIGILGDAAIDHPLAYFVQGRENLLRLTETEQTYKAALKNRTILRGPLSTFISDQMGCMSYCMGVDNTDLLPPFTPVQRAQEFVWAWLIGRCVPGALFGIVPRAILHQPVPVREFDNDAAVLRAGRFTTGETIGFLVSSEEVRGSSRAALMQSMSVRLEEISALDDRYFREHMRRSVRPALISWLSRLDAAAQYLAGTSNFCVEDVLRMKEACARCLDERDYSVPFDLELRWGPSEGRQRFREVLKQFSRLLQAWPALVAGARTLRAQGKAICSPVLQT